MSSHRFSYVGMRFTRYLRTAHLGRLELWERQGSRERGSTAPAFLLRWRKRVRWEIRP